MERDKRGTGMVMQRNTKSDDSESRTVQLRRLDAQFLDYCAARFYFKNTELQEARIDLYSARKLYEYETERLFKVLVDITADPAMPRDLLRHKLGSPSWFENVQRVQAELCEAQTGFWLAKAATEQDIKHWMESDEYLKEILPDYAQLGAKTPVNGVDKNNLDLQALAEMWVRRKKALSAAEGTDE